MADGLQVHRRRRASFWTRNVTTGGVLGSGVGVFLGVIALCSPCGRRRLGRAWDRVRSLPGWKHQDCPLRILLMICAGR